MRNQPFDPAKKVCLFLVLTVLAIVVGSIMIMAVRPSEGINKQSLPASQTPTLQIQSPPFRGNPTQSADTVNNSDDVSATPTWLHQYLPIIVNEKPEDYCDLNISNSPYARLSNEDPIISGDLLKWHPVTLSFRGPYASELDTSPNPFLDFRLQIWFISPTGNTYLVPGFFGGNGRGGSAGNMWQVRFSPDEPGVWRYCTSFRFGKNISIDMNPIQGVSAGFDGTSGSFYIDGLKNDAAGYLKWGRLEYVGTSYLKFADGPYWIKGGTNSPENFLGYKGFDGTVDYGGIHPNFLHEYMAHHKDWEEGDPFFISETTGVDSKGIIGALNYLSTQHVNSIYFLPLNLGGDGQETFPYVSGTGTHFDNTHFDLSKLFQWNVVLDHAQRKGIATHFVLNETELENRKWLDDGNLGVERKLFYREIIARYGYLLAIKWNISEESVFSVEQMETFTMYLSYLNWANHPVTFHNPAGQYQIYDPFLGKSIFNITSFQYEGDDAGQLVEYWRTRSTINGVPWVIDMDENNPAGVGLSNENASLLRKQILYDVYFSGGNLEWYGGYHELPVGGDINLEDFRSREEMWKYTFYARRFMEENLPFWQMEPADNLLKHESMVFGGGEVFAIEGVIYAIYLPSATPGGFLEINHNQDNTFLGRWYNPRTGEFADSTQFLTVGLKGLELGEPPYEKEEDWVLLITSQASEVPTITPIPYP